MWLGGFRSDMTGTKAGALAEMTAASGRRFVRHDYSGHGSSGGDFADGTISTWLAQSLAVFKEFGAEQTILVGSSMGAWIALRMVEELRRQGRQEAVAGLVLLAPAPDFTSELREPSLSRVERDQLEAQGYVDVPSAYGPDPYRYTKTLFDDGRQHRVLGGPITVPCPAHIIQGRTDADVPWQHAQRLYELLVAGTEDHSITISYISDGDHRLSRPSDIALLKAVVQTLTVEESTPGPASDGVS